MIRRGGHALLARRVDWFSAAFRVRFAQSLLDLLKVRGVVASKHGGAGIVFAGDPWKLGPPKPAAFWLSSIARGETVEFQPWAVDEPSPGADLVPGWTLAYHASGVANARRSPKEILTRAASIAVAAGHVYEARWRRADLATDWRGIDVPMLDEDGWVSRPKVSGSDETDAGRIVPMKRGKETVH